MRYLVIILALFTSIGLAAEEEKKPEVELSRTAERASETLKADMDKAQAEYKEAITAAVAKYEKVLQAEIKKEMRNGRLDQANALDAKIKEATAFLNLLAAPESTVEPKRKPTVPDDIKTILSGKWSYQGWTVEFKNDKSIAYKNGKRSSDADRNVVVSNGVLTLKSDAHPPQTWTLVDDVTISVVSNGTTMTWKKVSSE